MPPQSPGRRSELHRTGTVGANQVTSIITGMGPANALRSAQAALTSNSPLLDRPATDNAPVSRLTSAIDLGLRTGQRLAILVIGFAGSLSDSLNEGEIVIYQSCVTEGAAPQPCSEELNACLIPRLRAARISCREVTGISTPAIASTRNQKSLLAKSGATAVDMESYQIIKTAAGLGIPAAVVRVISDSLDKRMPDLNSALQSDGTFAPGALAVVCLKRPLATIGLMFSSRRALKSLSQALGVILSQSLNTTSQGSALATGIKLESA